MNTTGGGVCGVSESLSRILEPYHLLFFCATLCGKATLIPYGVVVLRYTFATINLFGNLICLLWKLQDIWKGRFNKETVCLKVLRLFQTNHNREKMLKVKCMYIQNEIIAHIPFSHSVMRH